MHIIIFLIVSLIASCTPNINQPVITDTEPPTIVSGQNFSMKKDLVTNSVVGQIQASDADGIIQSFQIIEGDTDNYFSIDTNGDIKLASALDPDETTELWRLKIKAVDNEEGEAEEFISINVEESFIFPDQNFDPMGITTRFGILGTLDAQNIDLIVEYSIVSGDTEDLFFIDNFGVIRLKRPVEEENFRTFYLLIEVITTDQRRFRQTIIIDFENQSPTITSGQIFSIRKDRVGNSHIGQVDASDLDGFIQSFEIIEGNTNNHFAIDNSGAITLAQVFNSNDSIGTRRLTIRIIDDGDRKAREFVDINVNESFIVAEQSFIITSNEASSSVGVVQFSEDTEIQNLTIASGDSENIFSINNVGNISAIGSIRYGISTKFPLILEVTSIDGRVFRQAINLNLFNEIPTIASDQNFSVRKDRVGNSLIGQVDASDSDGSIDSFEIIEGNANNRFAIDNSGNITLAQVFNLNDSTGTNRLKIRVIDHGNDVAEEYIDINVNGSFIHPDQIFTFSQSGGSDNIATVGFSEDTEQIQSLNIVSGNTGNTFSINNVGNISAVVSINYGFDRLYPLALEATTTDQRRFRQTITINLSNEVPMIALGQSISVRKDRIASSIIGLVQASDTDGSIESFEIIGGNASNHFSINSNNGSISLANAFTPADETGTRALRIRVVDNGEGVGEEIVNVSVNESFIADNQIFTIRSNAGTLAVGTVQFSENVGQIQSLNILNGNIGNVFSLDGSGNIRIIETIDYRLGQYRLTLEVVTVDQRTFRQDISIKLQYPIFSDSSWDFTVREYSKNNFRVGQVTVRNVSRPLSFFIPPYPGGSLPFTIDEAGQIKVNGLIDFNRNPSYTFLISVSETNGVSDTATVNVSVQKIGSDTVQLGAWNKNNFPLNFIMGPGFSAAESNSLVNGLITVGGNSWNNLVRQNLFVIGGSTNLQKTFDNAGNDNIFGIYKITSGWPADRTDALGVARLARAGGVISSADVLFNFEHHDLIADVGLFSNPLGFHFNLVIAHEFGHVLGLNHEPADFIANQSIMHPGLFPIFVPIQTQITSLDLENIQKLYQFGITQPQPSASASVSALRQYDPDDITIIIIEFYADGSCVHYVDGKKQKSHIHQDHQAH